MSDDLVLYIAGPMFNGSDTYFNARLVKGLEEPSRKIILPQRDGYEFVDLANAVSEQLPAKEVDLVSKTIIYYLDMGVFIPESDIIVNILNQPVDEGGVVEATHASALGKHVIGVRTDIRSPYGTLDSSFGGMHTFPALQSDAIINHYMPSKTFEEGEKEMDALVEKINNVIPQLKPKRATTQKTIYQQGAELLFSGVKDIHSEEGLKEIVSKYKFYKDQLEEIIPKQY